MSACPRYSPFTRSYQFMHLQNSAYHFRNKLNARPLVKTNLKRPPSHTPTPTHRRSTSALARSSAQPSKHDLLGEFDQPRRVIHRDQTTERAHSARISRENSQMVQRLIGTECMITDKARAEAFYTKQKKYRSLRRRYQESGERIVLPLGNLHLLNPTLASFRTSHNHTARLSSGRPHDDSF